MHLQTGDVPGWWCVPGMLVCIHTDVPGSHQKHTHTHTHTQERDRQTGVLHKCLFLSFENNKSARQV